MKDSCYNCVECVKFKGDLNYLKCILKDIVFTIFKGKISICSEHKKRDKKNDKT